MSENNKTITEFDILPDWVRRPAGLQTHSTSGKRPREKRAGIERHPEHKKTGRQEKPRGARSSGKDAVRRPDTAPSARRIPFGTAESRSRTELPVRVFFIPERRGLKPVANWLAGTRKAHPFTSIASMFLSKPEYFAVKLEAVSAEDGDTPEPMFQCLVCKAVFLSKQEASAHILDRHLDMFYKMEEVRVDPPGGNFICVAKCQLSGELLGPPNYHGYNERVSDIFKTRFSHMSLDEYRKHIVNCADESLVEKWKEDMSRKLRYSTVHTGEPREFFRRSDVESHFMEHHAPASIREGVRFIVPGVVAISPDAGRLGKAVRENWERECRFPMRMGGALHPAFKHKGLHIFKFKGKASFITAIRPNHIAPEQTENGIRSILETLERHPDCGRRELVEYLQPDTAPDSPEAAEIISRLCWLIERGHVIEFSDGKLVPPPPPAGRSD